MATGNTKLDIDQLARLILGLYDEIDRKHIIDLVEKSDDITPEIENAIKLSFAKQAGAMEKEIEEMQKEKEEIKEYSRTLHEEKKVVEKDIDDNFAIMKTDLNDMADGMDKIEEDFKEGDKQSRIEELRNKLKAQSKTEPPNQPEDA